MPVKFFVAERVWKGPDSTLNFCCPIHNAPSGLTRALRFSTQEIFSTVSHHLQFQRFFSPRFSVKYIFEVFITQQCSAHLVRIFSSTPVQLSARQREVEKEKETVGRWWRRSVLGARSTQQHILMQFTSPTYQGRWGRGTAGSPPPLSLIPLFNTQRPQRWISVTASIWRS